METLIRVSLSQADITNIQVTFPKTNTRQTAATGELLLLQQNAAGLHVHSGVTEPGWRSSSPSHWLCFLTAGGGGRPHRGGQGAPWLAGGPLRALSFIGPILTPFQCGRRRAEVCDQASSEMSDEPGHGHTSNEQASASWS